MLLAFRRICIVIRTKIQVTQEFKFIWFLEEYKEEKSSYMIRAISILKNTSVSNWSDLRFGKPSCQMHIQIVIVWCDFSSAGSYSLFSRNWGRQCGYNQSCEVSVHAAGVLLVSIGRCGPRWIVISTGRCLTTFHTAVGQILHFNHLRLICIAISQFEGLYKKQNWKMETDVLLLESDVVIGQIGPKICRDIIGYFVKISRYSMSRNLTDIFFLFNSTMFNKYNKNWKTAITIIFKNHLTSFI